MTADDTFIQSLPPNIIAEANVLRERVNAQHRQAQEAAAQPRNAAGGGGGGAARRGGGVPRLAQPDPASRRRQRNGKLVSFLSRIVVPGSSYNRQANLTLFHTILSGLRQIETRLFTPQQMGR